MRYTLVTEIFGNTSDAPVVSMLHIEACLHVIRKEKKKERKEGRKKERKRDVGGGGRRWEAALYLPRTMG